MSDCMVRVGALHINPDSNISDTRINQGNTHALCPLSEIKKVKLKK